MGGLGMRDALLGKLDCACMWARGRIAVWSLRADRRLKRTEDAIFRLRYPDRAANDAE